MTFDRFEQAYNKLISESNKPKNAKTKKKLINEEIIYMPIDNIKDMVRAKYPVLNIELMQDFRIKLLKKLEAENLSSKDIQDLADDCLEIVADETHDFVNSVAKNNFPDINKNIENLTYILTWYEIYKLIFKFQN